MKKPINIPENPFLLFSPFLIFFIIWVLIFHTVGNDGDEAQYRMLAQNLLHGFYSLPAPNINIPSGPGYPIFLMPFIGLHIPMIYITLMNALLYYLSIILLFKALRQIVSFPMALITSLYWALYYNSYREMKIMQPEILTSFLISLLIFLLMNAFNPNENTVKQKRYIYASGFTFGYLVLTKIIFGYVLIIMILGLGLLWVIHRKSIIYTKGMKVLLIAFAFTVPYLFYTYSLTGKMLCWGTSGGNNLYWMTTPYEKEYGDWFDLTSKNNPLIKTNSDYFKTLKANHQKDFEEYNKFNYYSPEQDEVFKRMAINNIKSHPIKFVQNCFSNLGRILFDYPYSYRLQDYKDLLRLPFSGIIIVLALFCMIPTFMNWRDIIFPLKFTLFFVLLYLGGSTLGSSEIRMFTKIVPVLLLWIAFIMQKSVKISWKFGNE